MTTQNEDGPCLPDDNPYVEDETSPDWPPPPIFPPVTGTQTRQTLFGTFKYVPAPIPGMPEAIRITDNWPSQSIVWVAVPQLAHVQGAPGNGRVQFHRLGADKLKALFQAWEDAGLLPLVLSWAGSWAPRFIRGSNSVLSNHAFGTAFDINAAWNGLGVRPALVGSKGSVRKLVPIANELGFYWGGHYGMSADGSVSPGARKDGMHFELAQL